MLSVGLWLPLLFTTSRDLNRVDAERERLLQETREASAQSSLLAELSATLGSSLELDPMMATLARSIVPRFADGCLIVAHEEPDGGAHLVASAHVERRVHQQLADGRTLLTVGPALKNLMPPDASIHLVAHSLERTVAQLQDRQARQLFGLLAPASYIWEPFVVHARPLGGIALSRGSSRSSFDARDAFLAAEIARRAGMAVENTLLYRRALEAVRARDDMLAVVSHDLRNPLTVVNINAQRMLHAEGLTARQVEGSAFVIRRAAQRMNALINDLLTASASESGHLLVEPKVDVLADVLTESIELVGSLADARSVRLELDLTPPLEVLCDRQRTVQVLSNLLGNALRFSRDGGVVRLSSVDAPSEVCVEITDEGPGVSEQNVPHLFDRFWKGHPSGTGLGLFIAKCLVEAQGGRIWVESKLGHGTTFYFTLPHPAAVGQRVAVSSDLEGQSSEGESPHA
jgi:signal transduction histidine kinase